jgi:hypothetical protein
MKAAEKYVPPRIEAREPLKGAMILIPSGVA